MYHISNFHKNKFVNKFIPSPQAFFENFSTAPASYWNERGYVPLPLKIFLSPLSTPLRCGLAAQGLTGAYFCSAQNFVEAA